MKKEMCDAIDGFINDLVEEVAKLRKENEKLRKENYELRQTHYHEDVVKSLIGKSKEV